MDAYRLSLLRDFAELETVRGVGVYRHLTPSAVSQQLRLLEREAGVALFETAGRRLRLTPAGLELASIGRSVATDLARADAIAQTYAHGDSGIVSVAMFASGAEILLPDALEHLRTSSPNVRLVPYLEAGGEAQFPGLTRSYDIVVGHSSLGVHAWPRSEVHVTHLLNEPLDIAVPAEGEFADRSTITVQELARHPWVGVPEDMPFDAVFRQIEHRAEVSIPVAARFPDGRVIEALVAAGHGLGLVSRHTVHHPGVKLLTLNELHPARQIVALTRADRHAFPTIQRTLEALEAAGAAYEAM